MSRFQHLFYVVAKCRKFGTFNYFRFEVQSKSSNIGLTLFKKTNFSKLIENMADNSSLKREVLSLKASIQKMRAAFVGIEERVDTILLAIEGTPSGSESPNDRPLPNDRPPPAKRPKKTIMLDELPAQSYPIQQANIKNDMGLNVGEDGFVHVYTDGACSQNGQKGAKAGYGVWWAKGHNLNRSEPCHDRQTNNAAEIQAVTEAIKIAKNNDMKAILIHTDSNFLIDCVTKWMKNWKKNGWKTAKNEPVKNREELEALDRASQMAPPLKIKYKHVKAHCGIAGNEEADQLAVMGAKK